MLSAAVELASVETIEEEDAEGDAAECEAEGEGRGEGLEASAAGGGAVALGDEEGVVLMQGVEVGALDAVEGGEALVGAESEAVSVEELEAQGEADLPPDPVAVALVEEETLGAWEGLPAAVEVVQGESDKEAVGV